MKQHLIFLVTIICLTSHATRAMEKWPAYFTDLVCPEDEELDTDKIDEILTKYTNYIDSASNTE